MSALGSRRARSKVLRLAVHSDNARHWTPDDLLVEAAKTFKAAGRVRRAALIYETDDEQGVHYLVAGTDRSGVLDMMKRTELTMYLERRG